MAKKVDQAKLLAKIAALTGSDATELKKASEQGNLYSHEEMVFESQSVVNYYRAVIARRPPVRKQGESLLSFTKRQNEYENARNEWKTRICEGCELPFAYAYSYEGVKFCSLDCLDSELRKIGLKVTRGRNLKQRWGYLYPAIVPSSAFEILKEMEERANKCCTQETKLPGSQGSMKEKALSVTNIFTEEETG